jgi:hypothetical protein
MRLKPDKDQWGSIPSHNACTGGCFQYQRLLKVICQPQVEKEGVRKLERAGGNERLTRERSNGHGKFE